MNKLSLLATALKIWLPLAQLILASYASGQGPLGVLPPPTPPPPAFQPGGLRLEHELVRRARGLPDFIKNPTLTELAQAHAEYMQKRGGATHLGPGNTSLWQRVDHAGYSYLGVSECVISGKNAREAVAAWLNSPNSANVLGPWVEVGFGTAERYHCAIYATPGGTARSASQPPAVRATVSRAPVSQWRSIPQPRCQGCGR